MQGVARHGKAGRVRQGRIRLGKARLGRHGRRGSAEVKKEEYTWCTSTKCLIQK